MPKAGDGLWFIIFITFVFCSDVLALPIFKQEDVSVPVESDAKNPPFQYVLCAATSPAVKLHEETLTYLNQGIACVRFVFLSLYEPVKICNITHIPL